MKNKKVTGFLYIIGGLILFFVSIYGYSLGIARDEALGVFQWSGTLAGALAMVIGVIRLEREFYK